jgi:hypothetical protein
MLIASNEVESLRITMGLQNCASRSTEHLVTNLRLITKKGITSNIRIHPSDTG